VKEFTIGARGTFFCKVSNHTRKKKQTHNEETRTTMDNPIYGDEHSTVQKVAFWVSAAFIAILSIITIALLVTFAFLPDGHWPHLLYAVTIVAIMIPGIIMIIFHKRDDGTMDAKLKIVTIGIWLVVIIACIVGVCYVFGLIKYPGYDCYKKTVSGRSGKEYGFLFRKSDKHCFHAISCIGQENRCVYWDSSNMPWCGSFNVTTGICSGLSPSF